MRGDQGWRAGLHVGAALPCSLAVCPSGWYFLVNETQDPRNDTKQYGSLKRLSSFPFPCQHTAHTAHMYLYMHICTCISAAQNAHKHIVAPTPHSTCSVPGERGEGSRETEGRRGGEGSRETEGRRGGEEVL
jgi:hypothetical protein